MFVFILITIPFLDRFLRKYNPDLIHSFFGIPSGLIACLATQKHHLPYIVSLRGTDVPFHGSHRFEKLYPVIKPIIKKVWKNASKIIANSEGLRKLALRTCANIEIEVIPNGVDIYQFTPLAKKNDSKFEILVVGRIMEGKGIQYLIKALPDIISQAKKPPHVNIIGTGPYLRELKKMTKEIETEKYISFLGSVAHNEIHKVYQSADVFILPSFAEGMPNVVLEAMASGLPIITTDTGGTKELIKGNGIIIPMRDTKAIADAAINLINNPIIKKDMSLKSREIAENMSWKNVTKEYFGIYEEVVN